MSTARSDMEIVERVQRSLPLPVADTGRLIAVDEAAERLGLSARTVRRLVQQRKIRHLRIGRLIRLNVWDVDRFLVDATIEPIETADTWTGPHLGSDHSRKEGT